MSKKEKKLSKKEQRERDYRLICSLSSNKGRKLADPNAQAERDAQRKAQLEALGFQVFCLDSLEEVENIVDQICSA